MAIHALPEPPECTQRVPRWRGGRRTAVRRGVAGKAPAGRESPRDEPAPARYGTTMLRYHPGVAPIIVDIQNDFADPAGSLSVVGLATDDCVGATAAHAVRLGFATTVPTDAVAAVDLQPGVGERALASLHDTGVLLHSTRMR